MGLVIEPYRQKGSRFLFWQGLFMHVIDFKNVEEVLEYINTLYTYRYI